MPARGTSIQNPHPLPTPQRVRHPEVQRPSERQFNSASTPSVVSSVLLNGRGQQNAQAWATRPQLSSQASITFNGCYAGSPVHGGDSIAQLSSNQLQRVVWAYQTGLYFSSLDANHETMIVRKAGPNDLPTYMVPVGTVGHKPQPIPFQPR